MYTLGINAAFHDPAACLVTNGQVLAAAEEERFTRITHGKRPIPFSTYELPYHAINDCLADVHHVAYSFDPYLLLGNRRGDEEIRLPLEPSAHPTPQERTSPWDPLFLSSIVNAPRLLESGAPFHLYDRFRDVRKTSNGGGYRYQRHFVSHHLAHAASTFFASPFEHAAIMTLDGPGERATTTLALAAG